jgi:hypothetical protein
LGDSLPPPAAFDLVGSFARRRGADVEIVLAKTTSKISSSPAVVTLKKGSASVAASAELTEAADGPTLTVRAPRQSLQNGTWSLTLQTGPDTQEVLAARLLVQGERPVVLLWGEKGSRSLVPPRNTSADPKRRAAAKAGKALDRALTVLPEPQAKKVRSAARKTARKILH